MNAPLAKQPPRPHDAADTIACRDHCPACRRPWRSCACGDSGDTLDREHDESTAARTRVAQGWAEEWRVGEAA